MFDQRQAQWLVLLMLFLSLLLCFMCDSCYPCTDCSSFCNFSAIFSPCRICYCIHSDGYLSIKPNKFFLRLVNLLHHLEMLLLYRSFLGSLLHLLLCFMTVPCRQDHIRCRRLLLLSPPASDQSQRPKQESKCPVLNRHWSLYTEMFALVVLMHMKHPCVPRSYDFRRHGFGLVYILLCQAILFCVWFVLWLF